MVAQVAIVGDAQDKDIGLLAGFQVAYLVAQTDGMSGVEGGRSDSLGGGQAHIATGQSDDELHGLTVTGAGVEIRSQGQGSTSFNDLAGGGVLMVAQAKRRTRQGHGDGIGSCQDLDLLNGGANKMIG